MLGCAGSNMDVFIFFENDEAERMYEETIKGYWFDLDDKNHIGTLESSVNKSFKNGDYNKIDRRKNKNNCFEYVHLQLKPLDYQSFMSRGFSHLREGLSPNHICIYNVKNLGNILDEDERYDYSQKLNFDSMVGLLYFDLKFQKEKLKP